MKRWFNWLIVRTWPIWSLIAIYGSVAYFGNWSISASSLSFNKVAGAALQFFGALLVLISLDDNVGLFKGQGIVAIAMNWVRDYPKKPRHIVLEAAGGCYSTSTCSAIATVRPTTIDGRVDELERVVIELRGLISTRHGELSDLISTVRSEATAANSKATRAISDLESKVVVSAVGGLKTQAFGVGLALLGSALSLFS